MEKKTKFIIGATFLLIGSVLILQFGSFGTDALWRASGGGELFFPLVVVSALIDSINPCAFGILLVTLGFLLALGKTKREILVIGGVYVLGIFLTYILIGLGILQALHIFDTPHFMAKVGAGILIVLGVVGLANEFFPSFPIKLRFPRFAHRKIGTLLERASLPAVFLLGALVGLCEFPCTGGPYLMILGLLHDNGTYLEGVGYLVLYNVVFIIPLVLMLFVASEETLIGRVREWKRSSTGRIRFFGAIAMILLGLTVFAL